MRGKWSDDTNAFNDSLAASGGCVGASASLTFVSFSECFPSATASDEVHSSNSVVSAAIRHSGTNCEPATATEMTLVQVCREARDKNFIVPTQRLVPVGTQKGISGKWQVQLRCLSTASLQHGNFHAFVLKSAMSSGNGKLHFARLPFSLSLLLPTASFSFSSPLQLFPR